MTNKIISGAFAVIVGGMAVKVIQTMIKNKKEMSTEEVGDENEGP